MKLYEQKETTPLKFYKFFMYVWLPLGVVSGIFSVIFTPTYYKNLNWFFIENIAGSIFIVLLYGFMFWGLMRWKKFTFPLIVVFLAFSVATCALNVVYFTALGGLQSYMLQLPQLPNSNYSQYIFSFVDTLMKVSVIIGSVASVVLTTLVFFYFYKRRRLFDDVLYKIPPQNGQRPTQAPILAAYPVSIERFCTACGLPRPAPDYQFCPRCGKKYNG